MLICISPIIKTFSYGAYFCTEWDDIGLVPQEKKSILFVYNGYFLWTSLVCIYEGTKVVNSYRKGLL